MLNTFTEKISGNVKEKFNFDRNLRSGLRSWKTGCKTFRQQLTKNTRSDSQQKKIGRLIIQCYWDQVANKKIQLIMIMNAKQ